jgi:hypothetical protein
MLARLRPDRESRRFVVAMIVLTEFLIFNVQLVGTAVRVPPAAGTQPFRLLNFLWVAEVNPSL